jgi:hypothetical protein
MVSAEFTFTIQDDSINEGIDTHLGASMELENEGRAGSHTCKSNSSSPLMWWHWNGIQGVHQCCVFHRK